MNSLEKLELLQKVIRKANESIILVEGKRDEEALREIGVKGKIIQANASSERISSNLSGKKVELLFDYDEEGRRKTREFTEALLNANAFPSTECWKKLRIALGLLHVEDASRKKSKLSERALLEEKENEKLI